MLLIDLKLQNQSGKSSMREGSAGRPSRFLTPPWARMPTDGRWLFEWYSEHQGSSGSAVG